MMKSLFQILLAISLLSLFACSHPVNKDANPNNLTVGKVQGEIKEGMPASDVATILGSPNIITTDEKRREVWVYDKVSSSSVDTVNSFGAGLIIIGGRTGQSQSTSSQKTLTIIIKFDEEKKVRDFAYNYTQF